MMGVHKIQVWAAAKAQDEYAAAKEAEEIGNIKIVKHAAIVEGHILYDKKRRR